MKNFLKILILSFILLNTSNLTIASEKIKIGLLVPLSGEKKQLGQSMIRATRLALIDINSEQIEIIPKDTKSNPETTYKAATELKKLGVKIVVGPIFHKSLSNLSQINDMTFVSLTNKIINIPKNVITAGIDSNSQLKTIKKFKRNNELKKTIFLIPDENYKDEIEKSINFTKIKIKKKYIYDNEPTKLTKQVEKITNYKRRKQNLEDEIKRIENSDENNKEKKIEKLKKKYTLGKVNFDSIIIADFDESLKSVTTSLLYTDVSPKEKFFITLNQWFDETLLEETSIQPIYFPSINLENYEEFKNNYSKNFKDNPSHIAFLTYDIVGLVYYLAYKNNFIIDDKIFKNKNVFKGKVGIFEIENNNITHQLNFYKIDNRKFKKIF